MQPARMSSRFAAMNLDMIFFGALWQAITLMVNKMAPEMITPQNLIGGSVVFSILYFVVPTKTSGQTLGKLLLSIKVVPQDNVKARVTWSEAFQREILGKALSSIPLFLGYIWAYFDEDHKAWHDSLSQTRVIALIWEEEKSFAQKFQQVCLSILSIPAGVALILFSVLYTSLPLESIQQKIEAAGIQIGTMTGSLGGGLRVTDVSRKDSEQEFSVKMMEVKFNLWSLLTSKVYIERVTVEGGTIEVPKDFSIFVILSNIWSVLQEPDGLGVKNFTMAKLHLKDISFEHKKTRVSHLQELLIKNMAIVNKELFVHEMQLETTGLVVKSTEMKSIFGRIEIKNAVGGVTPELFPILKAPVDFHVKGSFGRNTRNAQLDAGLLIDKIKLRYGAGHFSLQADQVILNEMFKTDIPVDELTMKLNAEGATVLELLTSFQVEYGVKLCGQEFKPDTLRGAVLDQPSRMLSFKMKPVPVLDFAEVVMAPEARLEDLFGYELKGQRKVGAPYGGEAAMLADLCYQKDPSALLPAEAAALTAFQRALHGEPRVAEKSASSSGGVVPFPVVKNAEGGEHAPVATPPPPPLDPALEMETAPQPVFAETPAAAAASSGGTPPVARPAVPAVAPALTAGATPAAAPAGTASPAVPVAETLPLAPSAEAVAPAPSASPSPVGAVSAEASVATASSAATPVPASVEMMRSLAVEAKNLSRQGKFAEAKLLLEGTPVLTAGLSASELGAFYNMKGWIYLSADSPYQAMQNFDLAFHTRKEIGDAEGLHRSYEALKKDQEAQKWFDYIKAVIKANPDLKKSLTPNMQQKVTSEVSAK